MRIGILMIGLCAITFAACEEIRRVSTKAIETEVTPGTKRRS